MSQRKIREIIRFIKSYLHAHKIRISKIVPFGSYAKSGFIQRNDIDIALVSTDFEDRDIFERAEMLGGGLTGPW